MLAPINKIPPEILALIPDFLSPKVRDKGLIALTHVCQAWREVFVSRSSLWAYFDCVDEEKTRVYFERSKSSPINLSLKRDDTIPPCDPIFQIIPHATGRLKSLLVDGGPEDIRVITSHLSHPAPLLEYLSINCHEDTRSLGFPLPSTLFNGDLSSLRTLRLEFVHTGLPWRNMANLTSFTLTGVASVGQLLDFFESSPYLEEVKLTFLTPTIGVQNGRSVSLVRLKSMDIGPDGPPSVLLDHLLIPVGAKLEIWVDPSSTPIREHLPKSLDNLKNFSNFTTIELHPSGYPPSINFSGPNGQVNISLSTSGGDEADLVLEFLGEFDTSRTKWLEIANWDDLRSEDPLYQALLPMKDLCTLRLSGRRNLQIFIHALQPAAGSSGATICPRLEEITLSLPYSEVTSVIASVVEMAAARASKGKKLRTIRIIGPRKFGPRKLDIDVSELRKHVWNVEYTSAKRPPISHVTPT